MRFKRLKRRTEIKKGQLDIAPMIDIVFLLLIFFMLTSNFVFQPGIKVKLPKAVTSEVINSENVIITITGQDLLFLNERPITLMPTDRFTFAYMNSSISKAYLPPTTRLPLPLLSPLSIVYRLPT